MATHGTILLSSSEEKGPLLMQTPHDGHTAEAIKMVLDLPRFVASKHWYATVVANVREKKPVTVESVQDFARCQGDFGQLYLLSVAHWIAAYHFDRWQIIPKGFEEYLADYDREDKHHFEVPETEMSEDKGADRYKEILEKTNTTIKLFDNIERDQRRRRFKAWLRWWWNRLTFRGYKNEQQKITKGRVPFKGL